MSSPGSPDAGIFLRAAHAVQAHTQPRGHTARAAYAWIDTLSHRAHRAAERHQRHTRSH